MEILLYVPFIKKEEKRLRQYISNKLGLKSIRKEEIRNKMEELYKNDKDKFSEFLGEIIAESLILKINERKFLKIMKKLLPDEVYNYLINNNKETITRIFRTFKKH